MITRRQLAAGLALTGLSSRLALAAAPNADLSKVVLRIGGVTALGPEVRLDASGQLKGAPYRMKFVKFEAGAQGIEALNAGAIDTFMGGDGPAVLAANSPGRVVVVGACTTTVYSDIIVPARSKLQQVSELRGKKVAMIRGSTQQYLLQQALLDAKIPWRDIQPVYLTAPDTLAALLNGSIDAWSANDPSSAVATLRHGARALATGRPRLVTYQFQYANTASLRDPAIALAVRDHTLRMLKSSRWTRQNPDQWAKTSERVVHQGTDVSTLVARRGGGGEFRPIDAALISRMQAMADQFTAAGLIPRKVDVSRVMDGRFNAFFAAGLKA